MKNRILLLLSSLFTFIALQGKIVEKVDSMRIIGLQYEIVSIDSRYAFIEEMQKIKDLWKEINEELHGQCKSFSDTVTLFPVAFVDTVVISKKEISSILTQLRKLKKKEKLSVNSEQALSVAYYNNNTNRLKWYPDKYNEYRLLIVFFKKDNVNLVWLDAWDAEYGYYKYEISNSLRKCLCKYTHIYDRFLRE